MDSGDVHDFTFNEAVSLLIFCKDQAEIDYYWENFSAVPEAEVCGWCKINTASAGRSVLKILKRS